LVVLPPRSAGTDVFAFDGPGFRDVADVQVTVRHKERSKRPASAAEELHARRLLGTRFTDPSQDFDTLLLHNTNGVTVAVRVVCILWEDPPAGATQQMVRSLPIGGLISIAPFDEVRVPVTGPVRNLARSCGSVKVYYSRPAPPVNVLAARNLRLAHNLQAARERAHHIKSVQLTRVTPSDSWRMILRSAGRTATFPVGVGESSQR
jgi:hypothetical protein